jgi:hypothetical protein
MNNPLLKLAAQFVLEPLARQKIEGTVRLRLWAQALDPGEPATWALSIRVVSRDGIEERGVLLPLKTGNESELFGPDLAPHIVGPLKLIPVEACDGDRIVVELGSQGAAHVEGRDDGQSWVQFSGDILFEDLSTTLREARQSRKIGKCIYCGRADESLSREHIIPEGLNGELTLTAASCKRHRDITARFEQDLLQNAFGPARIALHMRTKRPEDRPTHLPIRVKHAGKEIEMPVPLEEYPAVVALPIFAPSAHLSGLSYSSGITIADYAYTQISGLSFSELHRKYGYDYLGVRFEYQPVELARTVAKIGYGFAVLNLGLDRIAECYVLPALLGEASDIGRWVGCESTSPVSTSSGLHAVTLRIEGKEIHVLVRLFAQFGAPEYHVVVGRVR